MLSRKMIITDINAAGFTQEESEELADRLIKMGKSDFVDYPARVNALSALRGNIVKSEIRAEILRCPDLLFDTSLFPALPEKTPPVIGWPAKAPTEDKAVTVWQTRQDKLLKNLAAAFENKARIKSYYAEKHAKNRAILSASTALSTPSLLLKYFRLTNG